MIFIYFELLTWFYSDSSSTWSPRQLGFLLNRIPHPWTFLCSDLIYSGLDSVLLRLKVLIPFGLRLYFNSDILLQSSSWVYPDNLPDPHLNALSDHIKVYPALYVHSRRITLPDSSPDHTRSSYPTYLPDHFSIRLLTTQSYLATLTDFLI
jgi:hypothetical protein